MGPFIYRPAPEPEPVWTVDRVGEIGGRAAFLALMLVGLWLVGKATFL